MLITGYIRSYHARRTSRTTKLIGTGCAAAAAAGSAPLLPPPLASSGRLLQIRRLKLELRPWWPGADGAAGGSRAAAARGGAEAWRAGRRRPWEAAGCAAGQQRRRGGARRGKPWRLGDAQRRPWSGSSSPRRSPGPHPHPQSAGEPLFCAAFTCGPPCGNTALSASATGSRWSQPKLVNLMDSSSSLICQAK